MKIEIYNINNYNSHELYFNNLTDSTTMAKHDGLDYVVNSKNYRSEEFEKDTETLFLGCSFTYGLGLPLDYTWSKIVANYFGHKHISIASVAESAAAQVRKAFAFFKEYGNPKNLIAILPIHRIEIPINYKYFIDSQEEKYISQSKIKSVQMQASMPEHVYSKKPHIAEYVLNPEFSIFSTHQNILMLQQYCRSSGINFLWSTWEDYEEQYSIINSIDNTYYNNFIDIELKNWSFDSDLIKDNYILDKNCHNKEKNMDQIFFEKGIDRQHGINNAHWGWHRNIHIADIIIKAMQSKFNITSKY